MLSLIKDWWLCGWYFSVLVGNQRLFLYQGIAPRGVAHEERSAVQKQSLWFTLVWSCDIDIPEYQYWSLVSNLQWQPTWNSVSVGENGSRVDRFDLMFCISYSLARPTFTTIWMTGYSLSSCNVRRYMSNLLCYVITKNILFEAKIF